MEPIENSLNEFNETHTFSDKEIFTQIWSKPRAVLHFIHQHEYEKYLQLLLVLAGISRAFDRAVSQNMGDHSSLLSVITISVIIGGLLGWISYYIYAALVSWTGKWLNGTGNTKAFLRVFAYAMIPSILGLLLFVAQISIYGNEIFQSDGLLESDNMVINIIFYFAAIAELALGVYTIVLSVIGVSIVQQFSIGKSILNLLLPILVIFVPIFALIFGFQLFN